MDHKGTRVETGRPGQEPIQAGRQETVVGSKWQTRQTSLGVSGSVPDRTCRWVGLTRGRQIKDDVHGVF